MRPRTKSSSGIYHVIIRGVDRCPIFKDEADYKVFIKYLVECREQAHFLIYCYCLMGNHVHLLINDREDNMALFMRTLDSKYAIYFNAKYDRVGHLLQGRFLSKPVGSREYFYKLLCYILCNPEKAFGVAPQEYRWSSYNDYAHVSAVTDTNTVLTELGGRKGFVKLLDGYDRGVPEDCEIDRTLSNDDLVELLSQITDVRADAIGALPKNQRDAILCALLSGGASASQVSRLTGISRSTIYRVSGTKAQVKISQNKGD